MSFFLEALKPHASSILDTAINVADSAVSASVRADVRAAEYEASVKPDTLKSKVAKWIGMQVYAVDDLNELWLCERILALLEASQPLEAKALSEEWGHCFDALENIDLFLR